MKRRLIIILLSGIMLFGCEKENGEIKYKEIPVLNIGDAESLVVLESSTKSTRSVGNFYKITTDGSFEEIKFVNADGSEIDSEQAQSSINVQNIYKINTDFVLLEGSFSVWDTTGTNQNYQTLLVRKTDGAIFNFGEYEIFSMKGRLGEAVFQRDKNENFYFPNREGMIYKVNISNPESLVKSEYLSSGQTATYYGIDKNSNCIYIHDFSSTPNEQKMRIRKENGGIMDVMKSNETPGDFWIGNSGEIYFTAHDYNDGTNQKVSINKLDILNELETVELWSISGNIGDYKGVVHYYTTYSQGYFKIKKNNSIIFIDTGSYNGSWEFFENDNTVININLPEIEEGCVIVYSDSYYYIGTGTDLYKISLIDHSYEKILNTGEYEIYSMNVSSTDILQFSGLRFSDGRKVFCEIDASGTLITIDEEQNKKGVVLERLD